MSITLQLDGLHCNHCVNSVEKALKSVQGVTHATVTLNPQLAVVEGTASTEALIAAIDEIGFEAKLA